jgi:hypothetical protein
MVRTRARVRGASSVAPSSEGSSIGDHGSDVDAPSITPGRAAELSADTRASSRSGRAAREPQRRRVVGLAGARASRAQARVPRANPGRTRVRRDASAKRRRRAAQSAATRSGRAPRRQRMVASPLRKWVRERCGEQERGRRASHSLSGRPESNDVRYSAPQRQSELARRSGGVWAQARVATQPRRRAGVHTDTESGG